MIVTKKYLPRRTFLRGAGAALALPLLDGMVPAFAAVRQTAAAPVRRLAAVYLPNGMCMRDWTPATVGKGFELTPILQSLAPFQEHLTVVSGMCNALADPLAGEGDGDHSRSQAAFLTGAHAKKTAGAVEAGISMDQIVARETGRHTQLASLELALESIELVGQCENGYGCAYSSTIAWKNATTPLPMEANPRAVFERLFGAEASIDSRARLDRIRKDRSILDIINAQLIDLKRDLGARDRTKVSEYADAVRDVERRIQMAETQSSRELPSVDKPAGVPDLFEDYAKVMFDLMVLAYQTDLTRVGTFLYGREKSVRTYPEIGIADPHHPVSHHRGLPEQKDKLTKINIHHMKMFAYFLEKMRTTPDGDGSLLDHSIVLYGAGMSDSDTHNHHDLPILLAGGGAGRLDGNRHIRFKEDPLANLHLTLLDKMGIAVEQLADSTGKVDLLTGV